MERLRPTVRFSSGADVEVGTVFCIGRNYALHAREMGSEPPSEPFFFYKPVTAVIGTGEMIRMPSITEDLHHELELVFLIDRPLGDVTPSEARGAVSAVAVGLDMTMRDLQATAKEGGKPWSLAKGFDTSAPVGPFVSLAAEEEIGELRFSLQVNGETRQRGVASGMIFEVGELLSWLSRTVLIRPGDLLFTGTPEGVGRVVPGDRLVAEIDGRPETTLDVTVVGR